MDDQPLMRVMDGVAHLSEQHQPLADGQLPFPAVHVDRRAVHVLHHHERKAVAGGPGVEHASDVGVVERGENPSLFEEPPDQIGRGDVAGDDLDRHMLVERVVGPLGQVDGTHAATADLLEESIRADLRSRTERDRDIAVVELGIGYRRYERLVDESAGAPGGVEQRIDFSSQIGVAGAALVEQAGTLGLGPLERLRNDVFRQWPEGVRHVH